MWLKCHIRINKEIETINGNGLEENERDYLQHRNPNKRWIMRIDKKQSGDMEKHIAKNSIGNVMKHGEQNVSCVVVRRIWYCIGRMGKIINSEEQV